LAFYRIGGHIQLDVNGNKSADTIIQLTGVTHNLNASGFIL
jgi:hypothetical protein